MHPWITFIWIFSLLMLMYLYTSRRSTRSLCYTSTASKAMQANTKTTHRGWKACDYGKKYIEGTFLETQPQRKQRNYKSCRRRCIEAEGCHFWSYVRKKNTNVTLKRTCFLYSAINPNLTIKDSGRHSGDIFCSFAKKLKAIITSLSPEIASLVSF